MRSGIALALLLSLVAGCDDGTTSVDDAGGSDDAAMMDAGPLPPGVDGGPAPIPEGEFFETLGRLSVADRDAAEVSVWDLDVRGMMTRYELDEPATLYGASSRQITAGVAMQPGTGFDVFATGVWVWDHVDHFHLYKDAGVIGVDQMLAHRAAVTDVHVNGGWIVSFDDATGTAVALLERSIGPLRTDVPRSRAPIFRTVTGAPHDGSAVVARGLLYVTQASGDVLRYSQGTMGFEDPETLRCPGAGAGESGGFRAVFDCADDFLVSRWDETAEAFEEVRVERPSGAERVSRFVGEDDLPVFVGLSGDRDLVLVDPAAGTASTVSLDAPVVDMLPDRDATWLLVLLEGGVLLDLDPATGAERRRLELGAALTDIAVGEGLAYLADPDGGLVHEVDLMSFTATEPLEVGGAPHSLVVTALWPGGEPVSHER